MQLKHPNTGHRQRLRERFEKRGLSALYDYEILEILLNQSIMYADTQKLAKTLLNKYGNLRNVVNADREQLLKIKGIGKNTAITLNLFKEVFDYLAQDGDILSPNPDKQKTDAKNRKNQKTKAATNGVTDDGAEPQPPAALGNRQQIADALADKSLGRDTETTTFVFLDQDFRSVLSGEFDSDSYKEVSVPDVIHMMQMALLKDAKYVIFVHNHPLTEAYPSEEDEDFTLAMISMCLPVGVTVLDHIITCDGNSYSMYYAGKLSELITKFLISFAPNKLFARPELLCAEFFPSRPIYGECFSREAIAEMAKNCYDYIKYKYYIYQDAKQKIKEDSFVLTWWKIRDENMRDKTSAVDKNNAQKKQNDALKTQNGTPDAQVLSEVCSDVSQNTQQNDNKDNTNKEIKK